ncbi:LLM class flavin-dependent oxidoreductase [Streptomyces kanamyceticus]|uniref:LLM class flavin-dependent oxidoreductase n=1 Tax=Streptomyces kanamyceticus TaxID=1967 RepID=A0A5J6GRU6_STRKN|nr:LLM class flavin-dependent oxidoreductase [Streptomyces kanamyceticus]QEU96901.1 LLM class flavin-dependent oxidoreductase [Streptomyces kanamyceticus]
MDFILMTEGDTPPGLTHDHRYRELVEEVLLAEQVGFDAFGSSEQHVAIGTASISAPEVLYPYLMALTNRIRFIHLVTLLPTRMNHALRVAERVATEDILSHGRVELGTGRGNTTLALRAFEVDPTENKAQWREGIELIRRAFLEDPFSFVGEHYKIPPRSLVPKPLQTPHPPISAATGSPSSVATAASMGIGAIMGGFYLGFDLVENMLKLYDETLAATTHPHPITPRKMVLVSGGMHCAETTALARKQARPLFEMTKLSTDAFERLAKLSKDYAYMGAVKDVDFDDEEYMFERSQGFVVGEPEHCVEHVQRYADMGVESLVLRVDSLPHDQLMRSIELFGKYVIPHFKHPRNVVRPADDVLADIRAARPAHEEALRRFQAQRDLQNSVAAVR